MTPANRYARGPREARWPRTRSTRQSSRAWSVRGSSAATATPSRSPTSRSPSHGRGCGHGWTTTSRAFASCATSPWPRTAGTSLDGPRASSTAGSARPRRSSGAPEARPPSLRPSVTSSTSLRRSPRPRREPPRSRSAASVAPTDACVQDWPRLPCSWRWRSSPEPWLRPPRTAPISSRSRPTPAGWGPRRCAPPITISLCSSPWRGPPSTTPPTRGTISAPCSTARPSSSASPRPPPP